MIIIDLLNNDSLGGTAVCGFMLTQTISMNHALSNYADDYDDLTVTSHMGNNLARDKFGKRVHYVKANVAVGLKDATEMDEMLFISPNTTVKKRIQQYKWHSVPSRFVKVVEDNKATVPYAIVPNETAKSDAKTVLHVTGKYKYFNKDKHPLASKYAPGEVTYIKDGTKTKGSQTTK